MTKRRPPPPVEEFGNDDPTVDGRTLADDSGRFDSPVTMPRCTGCGNVVFFDEFTEAASIIASGIFSFDRCVRSSATAERPWMWCANATQDYGKAVFYVPRPKG